MISATVQSQSFSSGRKPLGFFDRSNGIRVLSPGFFDRDNGIHMLKISGDYKCQRRESQNYGKGSRNPLGGKASPYAPSGERSSFPDSI
jgi:hypothetical protein